MGDPPDRPQALAAVAEEIIQATAALINALRGWLGRGEGIEQKVDAAKAATFKIIRLHLLTYRRGERLMRARSSLDEDNDLLARPAVRRLGAQIAHISKLERKGINSAEAVDVALLLDIARLTRNQWKIADRDAAAFYGLPGAASAGRRRGPPARLAAFIDDLIPALEEATGKRARRGGRYRQTARDGKKVGKATGPLVRVVQAALDVFQLAVRPPETAKRARTRPATAEQAFGLIERHLSKRLKSNVMSPKN